MSLKGLYGGLLCERNRLRGEGGRGKFKRGMSTCYSNYICEALFCYLRPSSNGFYEKPENMLEEASFTLSSSSPSQKVRHSSS